MRWGTLGRKHFAQEALELTFQVWNLRCLLNIKAELFNMDLLKMNLEFMEGETQTGDIWFLYAYFSYLKKSIIMTHISLDCCAWQLQILNRPVRVSLVNWFSWNESTEMNNKFNLSKHIWLHSFIFSTAILNLIFSSNLFISVCFQCSFILDYTNSKDITELYSHIISG